MVNPKAFCLFRNTDKTKLVGTFHIEFFLLAYLNDLNRGGRGGYVFQDLILIEILFLFAKCSAQNYLFQLFKDGGGVKWGGVDSRGNEKQYLN